MDVKARFAFPIETEMKPVSQFAEPKQLGEKRECHLTAVRVAREHEVYPLACREGEQGRVVCEKEGACRGTAALEAAQKIGTAGPGVVDTCHEDGGSIARNSTTFVAEDNGAFLP
jgi:hypothetical protein